jgi:ferredoxin
VVETQDEDEVYEQQFGKYFGKGRVFFGLPLDED